MSRDGAPVTHVRRLADTAALTECLRLADGARHAAPALVLLRERATLLAGRSAQVRALGLERLTDGPYLLLQVEALHAQMVARQSRRRWRAPDAARVDQVEALLRVALEMTSSIDLVRNLDVPLEAVSAVQTGARAGLAALERLRGHADALAATPARTRVRSVDQTHPAAGWLLRLATGVLPSSERSRYREEFGGELADLATEGTLVQVAHALRQLSRSWALRRALPRDRPGTDVARVRVRARADHEIDVRVPEPERGRLGARLDNWLNRMTARYIVRAETRVQRVEMRRHPSSPDAAGHRRDGRHRLR